MALVTTTGIFPIVRDFSTTVLMGCGPFVKDIGSVPRQHQVAFGPFDLDPGLSKDNLGQCQSTTTTRIIMMIVSLFLLFFCGCCFGRRCSCLVRNGLRQVFACFGNFVEPCLIGHWTLRRDNAAIAKGHANHGLLWDDVSATSLKPAKKRSAGSMPNGNTHIGESNDRRGQGLVRLQWVRRKGTADGTCVVDGSSTSGGALGIAHEGGRQGHGLPTTHRDSKVPTDKTTGSLFALKKGSAHFWRLPRPTTTTTRPGEHHGKSLMPRGKG